MYRWFVQRLGNTYIVPWRVGGLIDWMWCNQYQSERVRSIARPKWVMTLYQWHDNSIDDTIDTSVYLVHHHSFSIYWPTAQPTRQGPTHQLYQTGPHPPTVPDRAPPTNCTRQGPTHQRYQTGPHPPIYNIQRWREVLPVQYPCLISMKVLYFELLLSEAKSWGLWPLLPPAPTTMILNTLSRIRDVWYICLLKIYSH